MRVFLFLAAITAALAADAKLTPEMEAVVNHVSADSLRGHLSFIASDLLEGRGTPSRGLDLAAEYIAAQFRRAGLEPAGDDGYFQTVTLHVREQNPTGFEMTVTAGGRTIRIDPAQASILPDKPLRLDNAEILEVDGKVSAAQIAGKVVIFSGRGRPELPEGAALVIFPARNGIRPAVSEGDQPARSSVIPGELLSLLKGAKDARITLHVDPAIDHALKARNVAGILRGSDPALKDTFVMLTAHYDHLGTRAAGEDRIYNGANDDGSGTVSVIEVASALAALHPHPKRSILFVTFFGEELGLVGSRYYGSHPLVPLAKTIADLNLEQVGRTDATNGKQINNASVTGFDYSELTRVLVNAGKLTGVKVYKDDNASDPYFARSDNQALADVGIPAHTLSNAYEYPDYHGVGDSWDKIDYDNMAKIDRMVALGLLHLASDAPAPRWISVNPKAAKYAEAARKLKQASGQ